MSDSSSAPSDAGTAPQATSKRLPILLAMAMFVLVVDTSLMNVSISSVVRDLDATASGVQSAIALEALVSAAFILIGSKIGDLFGHKRAYVLGLLGYAIGALSMALGQNLMTILISIFFHFSGVQAAYVASSMQSAEQIKSLFKLPDDVRNQLDQELRNPAFIAGSLFRTVKICLFTIGALEAVRKVFRVSFLKSVTVVLLSYAAAVALSPIWAFLFTRVVGSPFLLLVLFFLLRGYFTGIVSTQRARAAFKQNLEAATINPRDSSAHYNLGLIHQNRGELDQARERFQRAIDIDHYEVDAHYQLGRIARSQNRLPEAIAHFEEVVQRDQFHAQHEIWREIGAT